MDKLFGAESVLIVGVSPSRRNMGRNIIRNLIRWDYPGRTYLMGRRPGNVAGQPIHTDFSTIPDGIDLAVFLTPAELVPDLVDQCGSKGIRWLVIQSGGFSELADGRKSIEEQLLKVAHKWGIRFIGPNGLGAINRANGLVLPFMEMPYLPEPGRVSLLAQSGGVGIVYLYELGNECVGLDKFVSMGNKLSLDESDFLNHIGAAGTSDVACLYLEDVRRGRVFHDALRAFPGKVLVQKANVSRAGAAAARSHTASMATDDRLVEAAIKQAGALRVNDMASMVHQVMGLTLPPVTGNRLLILSRSGGHAVIAADYAERSGMELPELPDEIAQLAASAGRAHVIRAANPLDLGDVFDFDTYARMLEIAARGDRYDAIAVIHVFSAALEAQDSERLCIRAAELSAETNKPIYLCYLTEENGLKRVKRNVGYPLFSSPEILIESMAAAARHHTVNARIASDSLPPSPPLDTEAITAILEEARQAAPEGAQRHWLSPDQVFRVAQHAGLPVAPFHVAKNVTEAVLAAAEIGFPVVMKIVSHDLLHKSRQGGVAINVRGDDAVRHEFQALSNQFAEQVPDGQLDGILVQGMVKGFREVFLGGSQDPSFGPVVALGFGGTLVEVMNDISMRLCPVSIGDIQEMLDEVHLFRAFRKLPGAEGADFPFVEQCVATLSDLLVNFPEIDEIDLNPLKLGALGQGGVFVDARLAVKV
jgi:acetate---CoA ligase (ADP-forming)